MTSRELTYWEYIRVNELLELQRGRDPEAGAPANDETHFIVVHQVFELWFTLILRELAGIRDRLGAERVSELDVPAVVAGLKRIIEVWRSAVEHWSLVETLSPQGFLAFRDRLRPASGFQSDQLRQIEILMGLNGELRARVFGDFDPVVRLIESAKSGASGEGGTAVAARLERVLDDVARNGSVREALYAWLSRTPIQGARHDAPGAGEAVDGFVRDYLESIRAQGEAAARGLSGGHRAAAEAGLEREVEEARKFLEGEDVADSARAADRARVRRVRAGILFIETYRELPLLAWPRTVIDSIVEMEERFLMWRYGHARMVERMIGRRFGTGGSEGVAYLDKTSELRIFYDLWMARRILVAEAFRPELRDRAFYDYAATDRLAEVMT